MVGHGGSSAGSYLTDPTSPIPSHCASIVATRTLRINVIQMGCVSKAIQAANTKIQAYLLMKQSSANEIPDA